MGGAGLYRSWVVGARGERWSARSGSRSRRMTADGPRVPPDRRTGQAGRGARGDRGELAALAREALGADPVGEAQRALAREVVADGQPRAVRERHPAAPGADRHERVHRVEARDEVGDGVEVGAEEVRDAVEQAGLLLLEPRAGRDEERAVLGLRGRELGEEPHDVVHLGDAAEDRAARRVERAARERRVGGVDRGDLDGTRGPEEGAAGPELLAARLDDVEHPAGDRAGVVEASRGECVLEVVLGERVDARARRRARADGVEEPAGVVEAPRLHGDRRADHVEPARVGGLGGRQGDEPFEVGHLALGLRQVSGPHGVADALDGEAPAQRDLGVGGDGREHAGHLVEGGAEGRPLAEAAERVGDAVPHRGGLPRERAGHDDRERAAREQQHLEVAGQPPVQLGERPARAALERRPASPLGRQQGHERTFGGRDVGPVHGALGGHEVTDPREVGGRAGGEASGQRVGDGVAAAVTGEQELDPRGPFRVIEGRVGAERAVDLHRPDVERRVAGPGGVRGRQPGRPLGLGGLSDRTRPRGVEGGAGERRAGRGRSHEGPVKMTWLYRSGTAIRPNLRSAAGAIAY